MTHFWLDVTKTSKTSITSGFCTDVTLDVHFQGATLTYGQSIRLSASVARSARTVTLDLLAMGRYGQA